MRAQPLRASGFLAWTAAYFPLPRDCTHMILSTLATILPTFSLIVLGYVLKRINYVTDAAAKGLPEFAFKVALPVMLFKAIGTAQIPAVPSLTVLGAYFGAALVVWLAVTGIGRFVLRLPAGDLPALAMASTFSNVAILGVALGLALVGPRAAPVLALILAFDALLLWFGATLHHALVETRSEDSKSLASDIWDVTVRVLTNPLIIASIGGLIWQRLGFGINPALDRFASLLGAAGVPAALFAIGMAIAGFGLTSAPQPLGLVLLAKLCAMPAVAFALSTWAFQMPVTEAALITLLAGMPVGVNAYLFAAGTHRAEAPVSAAIAISTPLAALTLTVLAIALGLAVGRP